MTKTLIAAVAAASLATGCVVVPGRSLQPMKAKKCPPGHVWSDGGCHDKGKGHDKQSK
jgi:hypothetical protein